jgi:hypothetical protein
MRVNQAAFGVLDAGLTAHCDEHGVIEFFRPGDIVTPHHNMAEHPLSSSEAHAPASSMQGSLDSIGRIADPLR